MQNKLEIKSEVIQNKTPQKKNKTNYKKYICFFLIFLILTIIILIGIFYPREIEFTVDDENIQITQFQWNPSTSQFQTTGIVKYQCENTNYFQIDILEGTMEFIYSKANVGLAIIDQQQQIKLKARSKVDGQLIIQANTGANEASAYTQFLIDCGPFGRKIMNWQANLKLTNVQLSNIKLDTIVTTIDNIEIPCP